MSDDFDLEIRDEHDEDTEGVRNLRKHVKALEKQLAERETALAERDKELGTFRQERRVKAVSDILKAKGFAPDGASFYGDEDVSEDAVGKWIETHGSALARVSPEGQPAGVRDANTEAAERIAAASLGNAGSLQQDPALGKILGDPIALKHAIDTLPHEELVKMGILSDKRPYIS